jgi:hypothetical protein
VAKYSITQQATDDTMAHAHCMLDPMVTNTYVEYVILSAFPLQALLHIV